MSMGAEISESVDWERICPVHQPTESGYGKLDGIVPTLVLQPETDDQVAQVLAKVAETGTTVAVAGGQSKFSTGAPLISADWVVSTLGLRDEPEIKTDDLVVFAKAGVPLANLQEQLYSYGLFLPVDSGLPGATVGGTVAYGECGAFRDLVLGMKVALLDGKVYRFGGQTVKNVAGYDLGKLFIGSKGTLGVITELYLRVYPFPKGKNRQEQYPLGQGTISMQREYRQKAMSPWDEKIKKFFDSKNLLNPGKRP